MAGLSLLFALFFWFFFLNWITKLCTKFISAEFRRLLMRCLLFIGLLPLPIADEIIGQWQFDQVCKDNSKIYVNRAIARGKNVYLADLPDVHIKGAMVPMRLQPWRFLDVKTNEPVVSYNILFATGGQFVRTFRISEGNLPLTFKASCEPGGQVDTIKLFRDLGVTQVQRSALNIQDDK
jgi:hypothetical protein